MSATDYFGVFVLIAVVGFDGCGCVPRPCPQFLPVAIRLDQQIPNTYSLKALVKVKDEQENVIPKNPENNLIFQTDSSSERATTSKLLQISELSTALPDVKGQKPKKRRRVRPKETKKIILNPNSNWSLRTINDKPADEVLVTDKASIAKDLKDSTESALVSVQKLEDQDPVS